MVGIRIDYDGELRKERALRYLESGAYLMGVPSEKLDPLQVMARENGLQLETHETSRGWRVVPTTDPPDGRGLSPGAGSSTPDGGS